MNWELGIAELRESGEWSVESGVTDRFVSGDNLDLGLQKCIPPKKAAMLDTNRKALEIGQQQ